MIILIDIIIWIVGALIMLLGNIIENETVELIGFFGTLGGFLLVTVVIIYCFI